MLRRGAWLRSAGLLLVDHEGTGWCSPGLSCCGAYSSSSSSGPMIVGLPACDSGKRSPIPHGRAPRSRPTASGREAFLLDPEVDVDQRVLPAVLAVPGVTSAGRKQFAIGSPSASSLTATIPDVQPVDALDPHRNRGRALDRERARGVDASDLVLQRNLRSSGRSGSYESRMRSSGQPLSSTPSGR